MSDIELDGRDATGNLNPITLKREFEEHLGQILFDLHHAQDELAECKRQLAKHTETPASPGASQPGTPPTAQSILATMGEIMAALTEGRMTAADAKARLYAHQIALSAMRTIDQAARARQKEERLRKKPTSSRPAKRLHAPTASKRREAQRPNRKTTTRRTTVKRRRT